MSLANSTESVHQLGYGNTANIGTQGTPGASAVVPIGEAAVQVTTGRDHTCALLAGGRVRCWGWNESGQLGIASTSNIGDDEPAGAGALVDVGADAVQIDAGGDFTCALLRDGNIRCWGANDQGQLATGHSKNIGDNETPLQGYACAGLIVGVPCTSTDETCAGFVHEEPRPADVVSQQTFESCGPAWQSANGVEATYASDASWAACSSSAGARVLSLASTAASAAASVQSSWFDLASVEPGQSYCLAASIRWLGGPAPFVAVDRYDDAGALLSTSRAIGPAATQASADDQKLAPLVALADTSAWRRYKKAFVAPPGTRALQLVVGADNSVRKPNEARAFVDDLVLMRGACP
ncbi:MAG: hypothetical protein SF187_13540 [Deltaproteobacteria bacterium]|nr:hypothetical protein [Deltaproteobacteria bacterium]